jgi:hypothetical protein
MRRGLGNLRPLTKSFSPPHEPDLGRDIALRCPRLRSSRRNHSAAGRGGDGAARHPYLSSVIVCAVLLLACASAFADAPAPLSSPSVIRHLESASETVSFRNDVMAVLSKAGCNAGTCHGNKNGKGGFALSLRGQDPDLDYKALTRDVFGRRVNALEPERSLMLLKPTTQVAHEGGARFRVGSDEYEILRRWIGGGLKNDLAAAPKLERIVVTPREKVSVEPAHDVQLRVQARFSDGTSRDVTALAVYEASNASAKVSAGGLAQGQGAGQTTVLVRYLQCQEPVSLAFVPARPGFTWTEVPTHNYIDEHVFARLRMLRMKPSELCSDEVFLRRAYLDLLGILPTAAEARAFVASPAKIASGSPANVASAAFEAPDGTGEAPRLPPSPERLGKRAKLIEELLDRPEFADFWALKWADLLRVEAHSLDQKGVQAFHHWIRQSLAENKPIDRFVRELVAARGSTYGSPAANYYRPQRNPAARAKAVAQIFLGARLQCAECHNHPSDRWTQDDYYDWAGIFARVRYKIIENKREIGSDEHEWNGEQVVFVAREGAMKNPRTGANARPRLLGEAAPLAASASGQAPDFDPLETLADWLVSPDNRLFAKVQANRIWFHLLGRGLVDPPDDFRATNPASHPELLEALAEDFVKHGFDLRHLIRLIMSSRTYQLASEPNETNAEDEMNFSHVLARRLGAEQMLDCQSQVTGVPLRFAGYPVGLRAAQLPGVRPESKGKRRAHQLDQFLELFGKPPRLLTTDTERSCECNMGQAFQMISGPTISELLANEENVIARLAESGRTNEGIVDELFWSALTRPPTNQERAHLLAGLESARDRRAELEDVLWGLLNSKDFLFRR